MRLAFFVLFLFLIISTLSNIHAQNNNNISQGVTSTTTFSNIDSSIVKLISAFSTADFTITMKDGSTYKGKLVNINYIGFGIKNKNPKHSMHTLKTIPWSDVEIIALAPPKKDKWIPYLFKHLGIMGIILLLSLGIAASH
jgi:hypothetical protein